MDLSVVIISYNTRELTLACVRSLFEQTHMTKFEVILFDNASADGTADEVERLFPQVRVVRSLTNLGFAAGNNRVARQAQGRMLLLLNPDTVVISAAIDRLCAFAASHPDVDVFGGRTVFDDRSLNPGFTYANAAVIELDDVLHRGTQEYHLRGGRGSNATPV